MSNFSDFIKNGEGQTIPAKGTTSIMPKLELAKKSCETMTALAVVDTNIEKNDISVFSSKFSGLVFSDEFILELSNTIQRPYLGESEETFVKRCKESLFALIDKHLKEKSK